MAELISDGTVSWLGGMDTSRSPADIGEIQYSKGCNVIIPDSLGGIKARFGFHCSFLEFKDKETELLYSNGTIQGEGYFESNGSSYLICLVDGYVLKFTRITENGFLVENVNSQDRNINIISTGYVITIPNGCIVNNGFDYPIHVTSDGSRRLSPSKGELGIGQMGVYLQNRLFYVDQSGRRILASDFLQPTKFTREDTNIYGFACPDSEEKIVAIGRQKSIIGTVEGGNLIWSSNKDIYSADVRGTRSEWANLGSRVGKVTETVPGYCAASPYSFEPFNTNIYFRSKQFGIADVKQSEYQFVNLDSFNSQSVEAAYYLENDTDWMLSLCYTKACNKRLFTTVTPERTDDGGVYWNGILSFHPASMYAGQGTTPRRFESVFTGVRPWCITVLQDHNKRDEMFIHSHDADGINRMYVMNEQSDFDIDHQGNTVEIQGFVETKAYTLKNPLLLKQADRRFYRLNVIPRTTKIILFSRPEVQGQWTEMWRQDHLVCRTKIDNGVFVPVSSQGQSRPYVVTSSEKFSDCYKHGNRFIALQYRIEFTGPINLDSLVIVGSLVDHEKSVSKEETECLINTYDYLPDYGYSITKY
jgi:hypothetical protein